MMSYLLDTNHLSAMMTGHAQLAQKMNANSTSEFCVSMTSIAELWFMVFNSARILENTKRLEDLLDDLVRLEFSEGSAKDFGRIKAEPRRKGRPIPDPDIQIAAIARTDGLTVLTADAHFNNISNLKSENWLS